MPLHRLRPDRPGRDAAAPAGRRGLVYARNEKTIKKRLTALARKSRPRRLADLEASWRKQPQARLVAGSTDLGLELTQQLAEPELLPLAEVPELRGIKKSRGHWTIGAASTWDDFDREISSELPGMPEMMLRFGSPPIRSQATIGGNIGNASPVADGPPVFLALGCTLVLQRDGKQRELELEDFYLGYRKTALRAREFIRSIRLRRPAAGELFDVSKVSKRREDDISAVCGSWLPAAGRPRPRPCRPRRLRRHGRGPAAGEALRKSPDGQALHPGDDHRGGRRAQRGLRAAGRHARERVLPHAGRAQPAAAFLPARGRPERRPGEDDGMTLKSRDAIAHDAARLHVQGRAPYADDLPELEGTLHAALGLSEIAHGRLRGLDLAAVAAAPGVVDVIDAGSIPGDPNIGPVFHDEQVFASDRIE